jgi:hypothetical protein
LFESGSSTVGDAVSNPARFTSSGAPLVSVAFHGSVTNGGTILFRAGRADRGRWEPRRCGVQHRHNPSLPVHRPCYAPHARQDADGRCRGSRDFDRRLITPVPGQSVANSGIVTFTGGYTSTLSVSGTGTTFFRWMMPLATGIGLTAPPA